MGDAERGKQARSRFASIVEQEAGGVHRKAARKTAGTWVSVGGKWAESVTEWFLPLLLLWNNLDSCSLIPISF